jgi:hypothetical protein
MCRAAVRVLVVEEALAMLERDGPISLPDPPVLARNTKVSRLMAGLAVPVVHAGAPREIVSGRNRPVVPEAIRSMAPA